MQVTDDPAFDVAPAWSPDGRRIAFASNRQGDGDYQIWVMNADGSGQVRLTAAVTDQFEPSWSSDGTSDRLLSNLGEASSLSVIHADGTGNRRLIGNGDQGIAFVGRPLWMPGDQELLVAIDKSTSGGEIDIYRLRIADGRLVQLTFDPDDDGSPALSPDGSMIAFQGNRDGGCVCVMRADGTGAISLAEGYTTGFAIGWAPDGSRIGWAGDIGKTGGQDIQVIAPDGTGLVQLTQSGDIVDLAWGPTAP